MVIDWKKHINQCIKKTELLPIFHGGRMAKRFQLTLVVKKLDEMGWSNQKIFNWLVFAGCATVYCIDDVDTLVTKARKRKWPAEHVFKVYITMNEIKHINKLDTSIENKSFLLAAIAFAKMMNIKRKNPSFNAQERSYIYFIATGKDEYNIARRREPYISKFIHNLCAEKQIHVESKVTRFKVYTGRRGGAVREIRNTVLRADWVDWNAKEGYPIVNLETDVKLMCDRAFTPQTRICSICSKQFEVSAKTKRMICEDCYKKELTKKQASREKRVNHDHNSTHAHGNRTKGNQVLVCSKCGKEFTASGKCKRTLCDDCFRAKNNEYMQNYMKKRRLNRNNSKKIC